MLFLMPVDYTRAVRGFARRMEREVAEGNLSDFLNPDIDFEDVDWKEESFEKTVASIIPRMVEEEALLSTPISEMEEKLISYRMPDCRPRSFYYWIVARFSTDVEVLDLVMKWVRNENILVMAALRLIALLSRCETEDSERFYASAVYGLSWAEHEREQKCPVNVVPLFCTAVNLSQHPELVEQMRRSLNLEEHFHLFENI